MLSAVFFISASTPATVTPGQDFAKVQLKKYGQDVLMLLSYNEKELAVGELEYILYREHNPRPPGKWYHDKHITTSPEKQNEGLTTYYGNQNWTTQYLVMIGDNDDLYDGEEEILTSYFALQGATTLEWLWPKDHGALYLFNPFGTERYWVTNFNFNSLTFEHDAEKEKDYTVNMVWFEDDKGEVSNPSIVWVDKKPENHDKVVTLNVDESQGELNETLQSAEIGQGQYVVVDVDKSELHGGQIYVIGANGTALKGETTEKGVTVEELEKKEKYKITFEQPAKGGYSIHWGNGWGSDQRSDPVFVLVGKPGVVAGEVLSPLDATIRGALFLDELNDMLHSYIPENVEYNLYFYDSTGEIAYTYKGEKLTIINGNPTAEAVTVNVPVFSTTDGANYATYEAKLVLWYK